MANRRQKKKKDKLEQTGNIQQSGWVKPGDAANETAQEALQPPASKSVWHKVESGETPEQAGQPSGWVKPGQQEEKQTPAAPGQWVKETHTAAGAQAKPAAPKVEPKKVYAKEAKPAPKGQAPVVAKAAAPPKPAVTSAQQQQKAPAATTPPKAEKGSKGGGFSGVLQKARGFFTSDVAEGEAKRGAEAQKGGTGAKAKPAHLVTPQHKREQVPGQEGRTDAAVAPQRPVEPKEAPAMEKAPEGKPIHAATGKDKSGVAAKEAAPAKTPENKIAAQEPVLKKEAPPQIAGKKSDGGQDKAGGQAQEKMQPGAKSESGAKEGARPQVVAGGKARRPDTAAQDADLAAAQKPRKRKRRRKRSVAGIMIASALKVLFVIGCLALIAASVAAVQVSLYMAEATADDDTMLDLESIKLNQTSYFMALNPDNANAEAENDWIEYQELVGPEHRIWVALERVPDNLVNAVLAIEDREFLSHHGVDIKRTVYAFVNDVFGLTDSSFGASTIEQQLIKNLTGEKATEGESGYQRKMREMFRAWGLNNKYSKQMILEAYLNTISLSGTIGGVQAGALEYFGKNVEDLNLQECAMIAGITRAPGAYDPYLNPKRCLDRRNSVLKQMYDNEYITKAEYDAAVATPLGLISSQPSKYGDDQVYSYFSDQAFEEVVDALMEQMGKTRSEAISYLFTGGLRVHLTVDLNVQKPMEQIYYYGYDDDGFFTQLKNNRGRYYKDVLTLLETQEDGSTIEVLPQSASAIIDYEGALKGVVGGIGPKTESRVLNRATQSPRQVGSCMKPIAAYALGIENGLVDYSSMIVDSGARYKNGTGAVNPETGEPVYDWPKNVTNTYRNTAIPVVSAIAESTNTVAVKVGMRVGIEEMYDFLVNTLQLKHLVGEGSRNDMDYGPLVLGSLTNGITAYELAGAYMMFGNGGEYNSLHAFTEVYDANGNLIIEAKRTSVQAISPETAYVMNRLLSTVVHGTPGVRATAIGFAPESGNMDSIAKTGTTSDNYDRWIVGMTPYYVTAIWWGYDNNHTNTWSTGSSNVHPRVWKTLMDEIQVDYEYKDFPEMPEGVQMERFCTTSGELAGPNCPGTQMGYYTSFRVPDTCMIHSGELDIPPEGG